MAPVLPDSVSLGHTALEPREKVAVKILSDFSAKINQEINSAFPPAIRVWSIMTFYCVNDDWGCSFPHKKDRTRRR